MDAARLAAILAVISSCAPNAEVVGELDHAGLGNTLRVNYNNGTSILTMKAWQADCLDDERVHLMDGYAIIVVNEQ